MDGTKEVVDLCCQGVPISGWRPALAHHSVDLLRLVGHGPVTSPDRCTSLVYSIINSNRRNRVTVPMSVDTKFTTVYAGGCDINWNWFEGLAGKRGRVKGWPSVSIS